MKTKHITVLLTALALTTALSACGKKNIELAQSEKESETESKVLKETEAETEIVTEETTEAVTEAPTETVAETVTEAPTEAVTETPTETVTEKVTERQTETPTPTERPTKAETKPAVQADNNNSNNAVPAVVNTHTHNWKEHTVTEQVWVPNIVVVDDYEERTKEVLVDECDCGAKFYDDYSGAKIIAHQEANIDAAIKAWEEAGQSYDLSSTCICGGSLIYTEYVTETVKVGSHEEDHGHYEENTYVDYYYCDCGAMQ